MTQSRSGHHGTHSRLDAALRKTLPAMLLRAGSTDRHEPLRVERAPMPSAPTQMAAAQSQDAATRAELEAMYTRCLQTYRDAIRPQDGEHDDVGAAMALFVGANLHALNGATATPAMLEALEQQLRSVTCRSADWDAASKEQRQFFFERTAILGVLMAGNHAKAKAQGAAALAALRRIAREYLQQLLGFNADALTIGPDGLAMRER